MNPSPFFNSYRLFLYVSRLSMTSKESIHESHER